MITQIINLPEKSEEDLAYEKVIEVFNEEAKKQNSKYYLQMSYNLPELVRPYFWNFGNSLGLHCLIWNSYTNEYSFSRGIDLETFNAIKSILEKINLKFKIELLT